MVEPYKRTFAFVLVAITLLYFSPILSILWIALAMVSQWIYNIGVRRGAGNAVEALRPFVEAGPPTDDEGWVDNQHRERISVWFGPSDFRRARKEFFSLGGEIEE